MPTPAGRVLSSDSGRAHLAGGGARRLRRRTKRIAIVTRNAAAATPTERPATASPERVNDAVISVGASIERVTFGRVPVVAPPQPAKANPVETDVVRDTFVPGRT